MPSAYTVDAWEFGVGAHHGPQCSADEFCLFCEMDECPSAAEDPIGDLKANVRIMVTRNKELPIIVNAIYQQYEGNIRYMDNGDGTTGLQYYNRKTGMLVRTPEWSKTSIQRHLVFSNEFPECGNLVVHQIHLSIMMKLNQQMCSNTGEVIEEKRKAFCDTATSLRNWRKGVHGK